MQNKYEVWIQMFALGDGVLYLDKGSVGRPDLKQLHYYTACGL